METVTLEDLTRDTLVLACKYSRLTNSGVKFLFDDETLGIMDFIPTLGGGWICRAFPAVIGGSEAIMVPGINGVKNTMVEAVLALNLWLVREVTLIQSNGSA